MKANRIIAALLLFVFACQGLEAQTDVEKKRMELRARREIAKETIGQGGQDHLNTLEREAEVGEDPCTIYDDDEWYTAFNQKEGRRGDPQLANTLLRTCQVQLRDKLAARVRQVAHTYSSQLDMNSASSAAELIEEAGEVVVEQMIAETREYCRKTSNPDPQTGNIIMYMSIRVKKSAIVDAMAKSISNNQEAGVRINEQKFREAAFKVFEQDQ